MMRHVFGTLALVWSCSGLWGSPAYFYRVVEVSSDMTSPYPVGFEWRDGAFNEVTGGYDFGPLQWASGSAALWVEPFAGYSDYWLTFYGSDDGGIFRDESQPWNWMDVRRVWSGGIAGRVTRDGLPYTNAYVRVWADRGAWLEACGPADPARVAADGSYFVGELGAGSYRLAVECDGSGASFSVPFSNAVEVVSGVVVSNVDVSVSLPCTFSGYVPAPQYHLPACGLRVRMWKRSIEKTYHHEWMNFPFMGWVLMPIENRDGAWWTAVDSADPVYTDAAGRFSMPGMLPGWYLCEISDPAGFFHTKEFQVWLGGDFDRRVDLDHEPWDWVPMIPPGDVWILNLWIYDDTLVFNAGNFDLWSDYFVYVGPTPGSVRGPDREQWMVGAYMGLEGFMEFMFPRPPWPAAFIAIEGVPFM